MKKCNCMCKFNEEIRSSSAALWLFALCSFLIGVIVGFMFSPIKKGVKIGCNNGNNTYPQEPDMLPYYDDDEVKF
ncbi:hypothetical protein [Ruminococcus flavefaciens]|uniref:Uncharacterized protein n=1 Tax=Ruminococcus flavefaciens 007c TaxID=1341157 RepID=W7UIT0_RUMFL|nr:hypothetical protein [Ruminococcus flavefaciens]EWM53673.1 hypothetical protein RF007C_06325 [Ruminococcus flavefaciens 007c]